MLVALLSSRGRFGDLFDSLDQTQVDHIVISNRRASSGQGMNHQYCVLPDPGGAGKWNINRRAARQVQPQWRERIALQFLADVFGGHAVIIPQSLSG